MKAVDWHAVCAETDLEETGAYGFSVGEGDWPLRAFVVRQETSVFAYENVCPHAGRPLNWKPHGFLTRDRRTIMCTAHGAMFDIASGECVAGPCPGRALRRVDVRVVEGQVQVRRA
ncbi:MAG: Rieske (2Fe-2S) protein [Pseudomonadota bacterium]